MVIRKRSKKDEAEDEAELKKAVAKQLEPMSVPATEKENQIPMIPNYLDLILGEVNAIRVMLENQQAE